MTHPRLASDTVEELSRTLCGRYDVDLEGGVHVLCRPLPDPLPSSVAIDDGGDLWVLVDLDKPMATRHARDQLRRYSMQFLGVPARMLAVAAASEAVCTFGLAVNQAMGVGT